MLLLSLAAGCALVDTLQPESSTGSGDDPLQTTETGASASAPISYSLFLDEAMTIPLEQGAELDFLVQPRAPYTAIVWVVPSAPAVVSVVSSFSVPGVVTYDSFLMLAPDHAASVRFSLMDLDLCLDSPGTLSLAITELETLEEADSSWEIEPYLVEDDSEDDDGIAAPCDDCPTVADPDQADADGDGAGDACDPG